MRLPAPKWFAWIYGILFWVFVAAALFGNAGVVATSWLVLKVMFIGLAIVVLVQIIVSLVGSIFKQE